MRKSISLQQQVIQNKTQKQKINLPQSLKYPNVFKLKTASLVVVILIVIVSILDLCMFLYLENNKQPSANISFVNKIISTTKSIQSGSEVQNLLQNLLAIDPSFYFQYATKLKIGEGNTFTAEMLKQSIFRKQYKNLLYIFSLQQNSTIHKIGVFMSASFPIPDQQQYNSSISYYTFEYANHKQSVIFSLQANQYLSMNETSEKVQNLLRCKSYNLLQINSHFEIMTLLQINLSNAEVSIGKANDNWQCFHAISNQQELISKFKQIIGSGLEQKIRIKNYEIYYLYNSN